MTEVVPPPLRDSLKISKLVQQGELSYVIKEPDKQQYYHFEAAQFEIMQLFNGVNSLERTVEIFNYRSDKYEFDLEGVTALYESCRNYHLLKRTKSEKNAALLGKIREERKKRLLQGQGSLLFLRFQLVDPNQWFDRIIDKLRFFWHPTAVRIQIAFVFIAMLVVLLQGERFVLDFSRVYLQTQSSGLGLLSVWLIALGAIAVHECGHGLTCKYFGGDVHEMGFLLLVFQPCLYCNVNDAWLFENKWHKIYVALAGVWVELLLAAVSALIWTVVDVVNPIGYIAFVLLTVGTATSLLVNLNPLLKFDGYYILTDVLEIQNLRQNAIAWFSWTLKTKILMMAEEAPLEPSAREQRVYIIYGGLVTLYMIAILSFIALIGYEFISAQFGFLANIGFIILVLYLVKKITGSWAETLINWSKKVFWRDVKRQRLTLMASGLLLLLLIFWQPPMRIYANGVVEAPNIAIHAPESGFVSFAGYNQQRQLTVTSPQAIIKLRSPALLAAHDELQSAQQLLQMQQTEALASYERGTARRLAIEQQLVDQQIQGLLQQDQSLMIVAPEGEWTVDGLPPDAVLGRFYPAGETIITLIAKYQRYVEIVVDQRDILLLKVGDQARVRFIGVAPQIYQARVDMVSPLAKLEGAEQSVAVRMAITLTQGQTIPPLGLSGEIMILGQQRPLWQHIMHSIRKILRADLWL